MFTIVSCGQIVKCISGIDSGGFGCAHFKWPENAGGPLYNGDIEDLGGRTCMVCPWHKYKVCLNTGQNYYQSVDPHNLQKPPKWTAGDVRQRTHTVTVINENIYVRLSPLDGSLDSDHYNKPKDK